MAKEQALVGLIMGSQSDWETLQNAAQVLSALAIPFEAKVVSAHRTPDRMVEFAKSAESRGIEVIIAGAGGAADLPGMTASHTLVPVQSKALNGLDSLLSIVQMPGGVPVGTLAIGAAGAKNAGLLAAQILATTIVGATLSVTGQIDEFNHQLEIVPRSPDDVVVLATPPATTRTHRHDCARNDGNANGGCRSYCYGPAGGNPRGDAHA